VPELVHDWSSFIPRAKSNPKLQIPNPNARPTSNAQAKIQTKTQGDRS